MQLLEWMFAELGAHIIFHVVQYKHDLSLIDCSLDCTKSLQQT